MQFQDILTFVFEEQSIKFNVTYRAQQLETVYSNNKQNPMLTKELFMHTQSFCKQVQVQCSLRSSLSAVQQSRTISAGGDFNISAKLCETSQYSQYMYLTVGLENMSEWLGCSCNLKQFQIHDGHDTLFSTFRNIYTSAQRVILQ